ncbi:MAG: aminotransferase class V-fold PLP-dependent enzyme [Myxococcales bacterium]|nr:aminotransferase class V-fold PLP-dependent enzyme [Polyangiaceae bacterium]MDW8251319.1 aminotransferase class V-fold PLP-dependent enzyme [Myxococcales bacterium]
MTPESFAQKPPFGRAWLSHWKLDPAVLYLNHGTVGATPRRVLDRQQQLRDKMERHPSAFLLREVVAMVGTASPGPGLLRSAAAQVARFVGATPDNLGFVSNVTAGINAVLRAIPFQPGDEILLLDHAYGAIAGGARVLGGARGASIRWAKIPLPVEDSAQIVRAIEEAVSPRTRLAILDHITSSSALLLPIAEMTRALHRHGVPVLVDGAHAPGAVPVDVTAIGAEWYAANLHKWAWAPRSCGFLHVRSDLHQGLHAPILSWGVDQGLPAEFDWQGTSDPTPMLAAPEGIAMLEELGTEAVQRHNHCWAWTAATALRDELGATLLAAENLVGTMATVMLPASFGSTTADAVWLRDRLLFDKGIEVQVHDYQGRIHLRVSGQIYLDDRDIETLLRSLRSLVPAS